MEVVVVAGQIQIIWLVMVLEEILKRCKEISLEGTLVP